MGNHITYRPNLGLDKNYKTDGNIPFKHKENEEQQNNDFSSEYEEVKQSIEDIKSVANGLPSELDTFINTMLDTLEFIFIQVDRDIIENKDDIDPDISVTIPDDNNEEDTDSEDLWEMSKNVPNIIIDIKEQDVLKSINKKYCNLLYEISKDYIIDFRKVTTSYYMDIGTLIAEGDGDTSFIEKRYQFKTEDIKSNALKHVSDYLIKSQIIRNQKQRMCNKLFDEYESLNVIKACESSRELLIRYTSEQFRSNNSLIDLLSNMTLQESKLQYERKMEENLYELYKYLSSSVILLDECLRLYTKEAQLKLMLIKEEGINL